MAQRVRRSSRVMTIISASTAEREECEGAKTMDSGRGDTPVIQQDRVKEDWLPGVGGVLAFFYSAYESTAVSTTKSVTYWSCLGLADSVARTKGCALPNDRGRRSSALPTIRKIVLSRVEGQLSGQLDYEELLINVIKN